MTPNGQFPAFLYWLWLSLRARSLIFFSASNPGIPIGGMFGESKFDVLRKIPGRYTPKALLISPTTSTQDVAQLLRNAGMKLPVIFKPDIGERGYLVRRINTERDIREYLATIRGDFIAQELIRLPMEFGVLYRRIPGEEKGQVTSVVMKEMLSVTGDGKSTLRQLILAKDRARLQWDTLKVTYRNRLTEVLPPGEKLELVSIGNHAMGTMFRNGNHLINDRLSETFDDISRQIPGFFFGRYDLRCATLEDLYAGRVQIMELNGCGAEPAHIYDPAFSLWEALWVLMMHWRDIYVIARENRKRGTRYLSFAQAVRYYRKFKTQTKR